MDGRRPGFLCLCCCLAALLAAGCSTPLPNEKSGALGPTATSSPQWPAQGFLVSPGPVGLSGGCAETAVSARLDAVARDVNQGDGEAVAAHFLAGPDLRWEVREHFDAPNGTLGALRTLEAISAFVRVMHARREVWTSEKVVPPLSPADDKHAVYGARFTATSPGGALGSPAKVVIDCATGRLAHMVGPST